MVERAQFRQPTQEADSPVIGAFGGLSSATFSTTGNITYAQKLVNAVVNKRNEIARRQGSSIVTSVQNLTSTAASLVCSHAFTFDNRRYIVVREGYNLRILALDSSGQVVDSKLKTTVFNTSAGVEKTSFTTVIEDGVCFVICASKNTQPIVLTILKRDVFLASQSSPTAFSFTVSNYPAGNVTTADKAFLYDSSNVCLPISSLVQTNFTFAITSTLPLVLSGNTGARLHLLFACNGASAAYYPGLYLYNTAIRKNLVALDVNVKIPDELASNPIINEPSIQNLSLRTVEAYKTNTSPATAYTRVFTQQPNTVDSYDFSDGSYRVDPTLKTVRTPLYISFGALQTPVDDTRVFLFRWRTTTTVLPNYFVNRSGLRVYIDKVLTPVTTYDSAGLQTTDDTRSSFYYSLASPTNPGINLSAVVEVAYRTIFTPDLPFVDLTDNQTSVTIDDKYLIPFYGLANISDVGSNIFPSIAQTVGNRVVLSGISNKLAVSNSDWSYRGISWNNFQVSTINFNETSAYLLSLTQSTSVINAVLSVSGVMIVGTDSGIYRVSGSSANVPPNAITANVSRISNEIVSGQSAVAIYNNRVFFVSKNGLYALEYARDNEEVNAIPLSVEVSNYFTRFTATDLTYSEFYRGFLISFAETNVVLVYLLETETFTTFKIATAAQVKVTPTLDGYQLTIDTTAALKHVLFCKWDNSLTDLSNASVLLPALSALVPSNQTFSEQPQVNTLTTPAELLEALSPNIRQSYGKESARALKGTVAIAESTLNNNSLPIISAFVSKAFSSNSLLAANRVRAFSLLFTGSGSAKVKVVQQAVDYNDHLTEVTNIAIDSTAGYQGESLLNYQFVEQTPGSDNVRVRIRGFGVNEAWAIAVLLDGDLKLLGYQPDTSSKKRNRLR